MIIKVGIVEDEKTYQDQLYFSLLTWMDASKYEFTYDVFSSGEEILKSEKIDYHVIFMDIKLSGINGVDTSKQLRSMGYCGEIIFLTAFHEYVFDAFEVRALDFLLKPVSYENLSKCLDRILHTLMGENYILKKRDEFISIPYCDIIYIISEHHHMIFITTNGFYRQIIRIKDLQQKLPDQFIRCHRTVILNLNHIRKLAGHDAYMSNQDKLPISDLYLHVVRHKFENTVI